MDTEQIGHKPLCGMEFNGPAPVAAVDGGAPEHTAPVGGPGVEPTRRGFVLKAGLAVVFVMLAVFAVEISLMVFKPFGISYYSEMGRYIKTLKPEAGYNEINRSGLNDVFQGVTVSINREGLRSPEFSMVKAKGIMRVIVLGDSAVFGWGVPLESTMSALVQKKLLEKKVPAEVISAGVPTWGMVEEYEFYKKKARAWRPDMIVLVMGRNDDAAGKRMWSPGGVEMKLKYQPGIWSLIKNFAVKKASWRGAGSGDRDYTATVRALDGLLRMCMADGVHPIVFLPGGDGVDARGFQTALMGVLKKHGAKANRFPDKLYGSGFRNSTVDGNPNAKGHEVMAAGVLDVSMPNIPQAAVTDDPQSAINKYVLKVTDKKGGVHLLICYKNPPGERFDFVLNFVQDEFSEIDDLRGLGVNTTVPLKCVKYPYDILKIQDRIKQIPAAEPGRKRAVFIGDAFTFGEGVQPGCAFPDVINHLLKMYGLTAQWSSINLGRAGSVFPVIYEDNFAGAMKVSPDVIVYVWTPDSISMPEKDSGAGNYPCPEASPSFTENKFDDKTAAEYRNLYGKTNEAGLKQMRDLLARMNLEAKAAGVEFKVALFPALEGTPGNYSLADVHKEMLGILSAEGIQAIDLAPSIMSEPATSLWVYDGDHLPGVEAHFTSALTLMSFLKMIDKNPAVEKSSPAVKALWNSCNTGFTWGMK